MCSKFHRVVVNVMQAEKEHPSWRWIMIKLYSLPQFAACNIRGESLHSGLSELKECGLTLRVLHQAEISWGTYSDSSWIQIQTGQNCRQHMCRWKGIWGGGVLDKGYTFHVVEQVDLQSGLLIGTYDRCIIYMSFLWQSRFTRKLPFGRRTSSSREPYSFSIQKKSILILWPRFVVVLLAKTCRIQGAKRWPTDTKIIQDLHTTERCNV